MSNSRQSGKKHGFGKNNKGAETIKFPGTKFTATTSTQNPLIPLGQSPGERSSSRSSSEQDDGEPFEASSKAIGDHTIK
jgi:hypothetical protein